MTADRASRGVLLPAHRVNAARAAALIAAALLAPAAAAQPRRAVPDGIEARVPSAPALARYGGAGRLVYELHVTNLGTGLVSVAALAVLDSGDGAVIHAVADTAVRPLLGRPGLHGPEQHLTIIEGGRRAVLYLDVPIRSRRAPARVAHRIELVRHPIGGGGGEERFTVEAGPVAVERGPLPVLGPPLRGGPWVAVFDPALDRGHRRVLYAVDGRARIPGRFAIDWFRVDDRGRTRTGESDRLADFPAYGAEVLAVADGIIVAAVDGVSEPERASAAPRVEPVDAAGNYIVLDLGRGRYAFYEHLRPGLRVQAGDRVRRGQVIAAVGFTGQTTVPHLHFHVADAPEPLAAEGRPYAFDGYEVLGRYTSIGHVFRGEPWPRPRPAHRETSSLPESNTVVRFPDR
ncbi:MAG TPA: M23 family metallopeptidase [Gemmatimonadaceae bacterium]|nr:M23 family metallopeptidase [Gemmatimonadaceae bacterium]